MLLPIGIALFVVGVIGVAYGLVQRLKAGRLTSAPLVRTGDIVNRGRAVAGKKGQVSAQGKVVCHSPITAPFSGVPCLYYEIKCTAKWKDGDTHKSKVIDEQKHTATFYIDDGSGSVLVDAHAGGDFEPMQKKSETKGTGLVGGITGKDLEFGNYRVNTPILDVGTKYEVEEELLPLVPRLYACGRIGDQGNLIAAPSWRQMILSSKTRDELLAGATKISKITLFVGAAMLFAGGALASVGARTSAEPDATAAAPKPSASASAETAAAAPAPTAEPASSVAEAPAPPASTVTTTAAAAKPKTVKPKKKKKKEP